MRAKVIINPRSRRRGLTQIESDLRRLLRGHSLDIERTQYRGHAVHIARVAAADGYDRLIVAGGDGTINEALNGLVGSNMALGVIPAGTANDLATHYGLPHNTRKACRIISAGHIRRADLIRVNGWYYATVGGVALPSDVIAKAQQIRSWRFIGRVLPRVLGSQLYALSLALTFNRSCQRTSKLVLTSGGRKMYVDAFSLTVANQPLLGRRFIVSPEAATDDGLLDVYIIANNCSRFARWQTVIATTRGKQHNRVNVTMLQAPGLTIESSHPVTFFGDGELLLTGSRFKVEVIPNAVSILAPANREEK
ncbi:MAG TPA: diacylglycerol kinase family protein [Candidatus Deferrimicrobium sp.]|nr:diacylglycerol kinase family protein [Candidatus Deferrimicrobium sp.]